MTGFARVRKTAPTGRDRRQLEERQPSRPGSAFPPAGGVRFARERHPRRHQERRGARPLQIHVTLTRTSGRRGAALNRELLGALHAGISRSGGALPAGRPAGPERRLAHSRHAGHGRRAGAERRAGQDGARGRVRSGRHAECFPRARGRGHRRGDAPALREPLRAGRPDGEDPRRRRSGVSEAAARKTRRPAERRAASTRSDWRRRPPSWPTAATSPRNWCACAPMPRTSRSCLPAGGEVGKRLDFLLQEMNREVQHDSLEDRRPGRSGPDDHGPGAGRQVGNRQDPGAVVESGVEREEE